MTFKNLHIPTLLFGMIFVGLISLYLGQDMNWDLRNYHYYNGYAFTHLKIGHDFLAAGIQSYFNPLLDVMNYLMIIYLPPKLTGFLLGAIQGVNFYLLALLSTFFIKPSYSSSIQFSLVAAIALLGLLSANVIGEIGATFNDLTLSNCVLFSLLMVSFALQNGLSKQKKIIFFFIAGSCLGVATGLKLTMSLYGVGAALAFMPLRLTLVDKLSALVFFFLGGLLGFLTVDGYWMYLLWKNFANPVFPYYNEFFGSAKYYQKNIIDARFFPRNIWQALFYPFYFSWHNSHGNVLTAEVSFRDFRLPVVYLLLVVCACKRVFSKARNIPAPTSVQAEFSKFLITFFIASYWVWQCQFSIQRYALVLDLLAPLLIYILLSNIFKSQSSAKNLMVYIIFALLLVTVIPAKWGRGAWTQNYFNVQIPQEISLNEMAVVLIADEPSAFLRPFFPSNWRFIGIGPSILPFCSQLIDRLAQKQYPWFVIFEKQPPENSVRQYGFRLDGPCHQINSKPGSYLICQMIRL